MSQEDIHRVATTASALAVVVLLVGITVLLVSGLTAAVTVWGVALGYGTATLIGIAVRTKSGANRW